LLDVSLLSKMLVGVSGTSQGQRSTHTSYLNKLLKIWGQRLSRCQTNHSTPSRLPVNPTGAPCPAAAPSAPPGLLPANPRLSPASRPLYRAAMICQQLCRPDRLIPPAPRQTLRSAPLPANPPIASASRAFYPLQRTRQATFWRRPEAGSQTAQAGCDPDRCSRANAVGWAKPARDGPDLSWRRSGVPIRAAARSGGWARCALPILQTTIKPTHISFDRTRPSPGPG